jgi:hypothetical protein
VQSRASSFRLLYNVKLQASVPSQNSSFCTISSFILQASVQSQDSSFITRRLKQNDECRFGELRKGLAAIQNFLQIADATKKALA